MSESTAHLVFRLCSKPLLSCLLLGWYFSAVVAAAAPTLNTDPLDTWQPRNPFPPGTSLNAVCYGHGLWVAVGINGVTATSPDGISWTLRSSGTDYNLSGISYGNGLWAAIGVGAPAADGALLVSSDGINWTILSLGSSTRSCIGYGDGRWAIGHWTSFWRYSRFSFNNLPNRSNPPVPVSLDYYLSGISYANGQWVAVGDSGTILTSTNRSEWTLRPSGTPATLMGVGFGNGLWVAVANDGTILTSEGSVRLPALSITLSGTNAVLAWPADAIGFVLETTANLAAPQDWTPVSNAPVTANPQNTITEAIAGSARFYRLRKQ